MARNPDYAERLKKAIDLRKAGHTYETIAEQCGWNSPQAAHKAVQKALTDTLREASDDLRTLEALRIDRMLAGLWPKAITGNAAAVRAVISLMDRRARLLGLDQKTTDITITSGVDDWLQHMTGR